MATYVDGVYQGATYGSQFSFNNIERIEVDKGPQGTLFGRNATGGVIQIFTKDPSQTPSADLSAGYGNYNTFVSTFYGTTGITNKLAADLSLFESNQASGWGRNVNFGNPVNDGREQDVRTKWKYDATDDTIFRLSMDYDRWISGVGAALRVLPGSYTFDGKSSPGFYNINSDYANAQVDNKQWGASLNVHQDMSWAQFTSISSYRDVVTHNPIDVDATPLPLFTAISDDAIFHTTTQEFQLASRPESTIKWIGGLFYYYQNAGYNPLLLYGAALAPASAEQLYSLETTDSYAGYTQATAPVMAQTNVTVGVRYTIDKRAIKSHAILTLAGAPLELPASEQSEKFPKTTYHFSLDHHFADDVMGYLEYSRGFKSGVYNSVSPTDAPVRPEVLDAYEIGGKTELFDHRLRLNTSAFLYNFNDMQLSRVVGAGTVLFNAARARMKGIDLDAEATPVSHLNIQAAISYLDAHYTEFPDAPFLSPAPGGGNITTSGDASGNVMEHAPKVQSSLGAQYDIPASSGRYIVAVEYHYNSSYFFAVDNRIQQPSYSILNASLDWTAPNGSWELRLWGKNLANQRYYLYADETAFGDLGSPAPPLTYGVTATFHLK